MIIFRKVMDLSCGIDLSRGDKVTCNKNSYISLTPRIYEKGCGHRLYRCISDRDLSAWRPKSIVKTIYPRGKGPTQELYSSSRRTAVVPLFKNYMDIFIGYFSGLGNVSSPSSNEHGSWWASNIRPFD